MKSLSLLFLHTSHWNLCVSHSRFSLFPQLRVVFFCVCFVLLISLPFHWQMRSNRWTLWVSRLSGPQMSSVFVDSIQPSFLSICDMRANFKTTTGRLGSTGRKFVFCLGPKSVCCCTQLLVFSKIYMPVKHVWGIQDITELNAKNERKVRKTWRHKQSTLIMCTEKCKHSW